MENIIIAIITGIVAIIVAYVGLQQRRDAKTIEALDGSKISKIDVKKLIIILNDTVDAQAHQIASLKGFLDEQKILLNERNEQLGELTKRVSKLEQLVVEQAIVIQTFEAEARQRLLKGGDI